MSYAASASALRLASLAYRKRRGAGRFLSTGRRIGPARADRLGAAAPADQLDRNHARGRDSGDPGHSGVRLVVPVIQSSRQPRLGRKLRRAHRVCYLVDPGADRDPVGWGHLGSHQLDPCAPIPSDTKPLRVEVVALDWKWLFVYPDQGIAAVNQLVVPVGTPIEFRLT